jgi:hypothetical protein
LARWLLNWLLSRVEFTIYTSPEPVGKRLGGADIRGVTDRYLILTLIFNGSAILTGHFQTS